MSDQCQPPAAWIRIWDVELPQKEHYIMVALARFGDDEGKNIAPGRKTLAHNCGYSIKQIGRWLDSFVTKQYLILEEVGYGEYGTNRYSINWDALPMKAPIELRPTGRPVEKGRDILVPDLASPSLLDAEKGRDIITPILARPFEEGEERKGRDISECRDIDVPDLARPFEGVDGKDRDILEKGRDILVPKSTQIESYQLRDSINDDSNQIAVVGNFVENERTEQRYSPYVALVITDFSNELGDGGHTVSNVSQPLTIFRGSELEEGAFVDLLYQAKTQVRSYQNRQGMGTINNKMAYFFRVLRNLLGLGGVSARGTPAGDGQAEAIR